MLTSLIIAAALAPPIRISLYAHLTGQEVTSIAFSPSGTQFACGMADNTVKIFDAKTKQGVKVLKGHKFPARAIAWGPGNRLVSGAENGELRLWDIKTGASKAWSGHIRAVQWIAFNRAGNRIITTGVDDVIKVWAPGNFKPLLTILGKGINVYGARYDASGSKIVAATLGGGLVTYSANTGAELKRFGGHGGVGVNDIATFGLRAITAGRDGKVGIWDISTGARKTYLNAHKDWVLNVAIDPSGQLFATSSSDGTIKVWDMKTLKPVATFDKMNYVVSPLAWSASGGVLAAVAQDNYLSLYTVGK
jgi:WD40 repeat protein